MKKLIVSILAVLYITASTGSTVYSHYCMGSFVSASLFDSDDHTCGKCGMEKKTSDNGCCKDEKQLIKTGENHVSPFVVSLPAPSQQAVLPTSYFTLTSNYSTAVKRHFSHFYHPPDDEQVPIYLRVRNFRI